MLGFPLEEAYERFLDQAGLGAPTATQQHDSNNSGNSSPFADTPLGHHHHPMIGDNGGGGGGGGSGGGGGGGGGGVGGGTWRLGVPTPMPGIYAAASFPEAMQCLANAMHGQGFVLLGSSALRSTVFYGIAAAMVKSTQMAPLPPLGFPYCASFSQELLVKAAEVSAVIASRSHETCGCLISLKIYCARMM